MILNYDLCMAIGQDAGNHHMRKNGRDRWNEDDREIASKTANELLNAIKKEEAEWTHIH